MPTENNNRSAIAQILSKLALPLRDLPYTAEFETVYAAYKATEIECDRHDFWELLLAVSLLPSDRSAPIQTAFAPPPPIAPSKVEAGTPIVEVLPTISEGAGPLFESAQKESYALQEWNLKNRPPQSDTILSAAQIVLAAIARSELSTIEHKLAYLLMRFPETRDSDVSLAIRFWTIFQADVLEKWDKSDLTVLYDLQPMTTIARMRAHIQNTLRLFIGSDFSAGNRAGRQTEFGRYLAVSSSTQPEIRLFLDETGDNAKTFTGIAGVCVMNWRQYEKHWAAFAQWRQSMGWPETIHFADTGSLLQPRAMQLLSQLDLRKGGLLFVGYVLSSRSHLHQILADLFIQIALDSLRHMRSINCLNGSKVLTVVKEAETGFDQLIPQVEKCLADQLSREFPGQIALKGIEALPKGREILLECADVIAGGMQRRAIYKGSNPKDVLAEAVFNVTGFEDTRDNGTVFKAHP